MWSAVAVLGELARVGAAEAGVLAFDVAFVPAAHCNVEDRALQSASPLSAEAMAFPTISWSGVVSSGGHGGEVDPTEVPCGAPAPHGRPAIAVATRVRR